MPNHRVVEEWMGEQVETLEDLLRQGLRAVCVGINPSPVSVAAGHYYQGRAGQRFFARLRDAKVIPLAKNGYEDDAAFAAGVGFTDLVKRPTASAKEMGQAELQYGRKLLESKLTRGRPDVVIFTFKKTAEVLFGQFAGNGFLSDAELGGCELFVMPGPYERADTASKRLAELRARLA